MRGKKATRGRDTVVRASSDAGRAASVLAQHSPADAPRPLDRRCSSAIGAPGAGTVGAVETRLIQLAILCHTHTVFRRDGGVMSKFERLLVAGSTELPDCRCTAEMHLVAVVAVPAGDTEIRIFRCPDCSHELRLTAWQDNVGV
jgi:hypothetical protein